ncbi:MAG TPA: hypothetical protein VNJ01_11280 [Bacteriovoracaceae bacterium]|nr:hypothetical protein [Bacteriovoracaceae bacterium]
MKTYILPVLSFLWTASAYTAALPSSYTALLPFIQQAPDQGETGTCLYVASTGAMELLANKKYNIKNPKAYGRFDLAESYLIHAPGFASEVVKSFWEEQVMKFNWGHGIHVKDWSYDAWNETYVNRAVWDYQSWEGMKKVPLPKVETIPLFAIGDRWSTYVLEDENIQQIKEALFKYKSPVLANYNDDGTWHVILIVGFDDTLPGICYDTVATDCTSSVGAFYVRDSFGIKAEVRNYGWFKAKGNAAFVVKESI